MRISKAKEKVSLTSSNNGGSASTSFSTSSSQGQDVAEPAQSHLLAVAVKVRHQGAGSLILAQFASVRGVTDSENCLEPARASGDGTTVHPNVKTGTATVCAVATLANTTEGERWDVQGGIVAGNTAGTGRRQD